MVETEQPFIHLQQRKELQIVSSILQDTKPNWNKVISSLQKSTVFQRRGKDVNSVRGILFEQHISLVLMDLMKNKLGVHEISLPPDGIELDAFTVRREDEKTLEYRAYSRVGEGYTEYDALFSVGEGDDQMVTVGEATTTIQKNINWKYKKLSHEGIVQYFSPLQELFQTSVFGYLFCILDSVAIQDLPKLVDFSERSGYVVSIPIQEKDIREVSRDLSSSLK